MQEEREIEAPSLLDNLWSSLEELSNGEVLRGEDIASAAPMLRILVTVVESRHPARSILLSQSQFWSHIRSVWTAVLEGMEGSPVDGHVACVSHILDLVTCVLYDVTRGKHSDWQAANDKADPDPSEGGLPTIPEVGSSGALKSAQAVPADLWKLVADIYSSDSVLTTWLLRHGQSQHVLAACDKAEALLTETAQAAAVLVCLSSHIPPFYWHYP